MISILLIVTFLIQDSQCQTTTVLHMMNITMHKRFVIANATIVYEKPGDKSTYMVDLDEYATRDITPLMIQFKLVKFPAVNKWNGGTVLIDMNIDMCDATGIPKKRKSDIYFEALRQLWNKFGNGTLTCPVAKGGYAARGMTLNKIKLPILQYFVKEDDFHLTFKLYTKEKGKLVLFQTVTYIGGVRKV